MVGHEEAVLGNQWGKEGLDVFHRGMAYGDDLGNHGIGIGQGIRSHRRREALAPGLGGGDHLDHLSRRHGSKTMDLQDRFEDLIGLIHRYLGG